MLDIRDSASSRLKVVDSEIEEEKKESTGEEEAEAWYLRRLDGGLFTLQTVDYILAWISMEDDGVRTSFVLIASTKPHCQVREHVLKMLNRKSLSMKDITATLRVFYDNVDDAQSAPSKDSLSQREILGGLIAAFDAN